MARVTVSTRSVTIDPLGHSQPLGGVLALLGVARCLPLLHGSQGCSAFIKALLTRHFREPIPLATTALTESAAVLGGADALTEALATITTRHRPAVIGVLTTGLTEVTGERPAESIKRYLASSDLPSPPLVITASTPDFRGGLSDGWSAALTALVTADLRAADFPAEPENGPDRSRSGPTRDGPGRDSPTRDGPVRNGPGATAVLTGVSLTCADVDELSDLVRAFGLVPIVVPDLSRSVDGHLADRWTPLTTGGTTRFELANLARAARVFGVGASASVPAAALAGSAGVGFRSFDHCGGIAATDALVIALMEDSGRQTPARVRRWRRRLADGLLDSHFVLGGARVGLAGEPEWLAACAAVLTEAGARIVTAVAPVEAGVLRKLPCDEVLVGDLVDFEERAKAEGVELVVASSHARPVAERLKAAHLVAGFPVYDRLGATLRGGHGYRGSLGLLFEAANRLSDHRAGHERAPIRPMRREGEHVDRSLRHY